MIIYKITNKINSKVYIGQTTKDINIRWKWHTKSKGCKYLYNAIKKHGKENFKIEKICTVLKRKHLNDIEILCIAQFNSLSPNGYNICIGGKAPMKNRKHNKKTKEKISNSMKQKDVSHLHILESKQKSLKTRIKNGKTKGIPRSQEVKDKISKANSGKNHGMYGKRGFNCPNFKCAIKCVETGQIFGSQSEAARKLGLQQSNIYKVIKGSRSHTGGLTFIEIYGDYDGNNISK